MKTISAATFGIAAAVLISTSLTGAQSRSVGGSRSEPPAYVNVHIFPHELNSSDYLTDGESVNPLRLDNNTMLIWVDLEPDRRYVHQTAYILVSPGQTRVEEGRWWPVLNGRKILYGSMNSVTIISPFRVKTFDGRQLDVHFHPGLLSPEDRLRDGPFGQEIALKCKSFLAWIDTQPGMFFAHPTSYILIGVDKTIRVEQGSWWPELNGKMILYGNAAAFGVPSPFRIF